MSQTPPHRLDKVAAPSKKRTAAEEGKAEVEAAAAARETHIKALQHQHHAMRSRHSQHVERLEAKNRALAQQKQRLDTELQGYLRSQNGLLEQLNAVVTHEAHEAAHGGVPTSEESDAAGAE